MTYYVIVYTLLTQYVSNALFCKAFSSINVDLFLCTQHTNWCFWCTVHPLYSKEVNVSCRKNLNMHVTAIGWKCVYKYTFYGCVQRTHVHTLLFKLFKIQKLYKNRTDKTNRSDIRVHCCLQTQGLLCWNAV